MKISTSNSASVMTFSLLVFLAGFLFPHHALQAQEDAEKQTTQPLHIVSDKMVALKDQSMVEFIGNVRATQTDSVLLADSVKIFFNTEETDADAQSNVKTIIATGSVHYTQGDRDGFADKAVYTAVDETLILTGKAPKLKTGASFVTGKKITLFRNQDKVLVESDGTQRVEALFNPEDNPADQP